MRGRGFSSRHGCKRNGCFLVHKHALRVMQDGALIINMSSVAGIIGTAAHIAYSTSKGAVRVMTKAAAIECAQLGTGVRVNSIHPAIVETDMGASFVNDYVDLGLVPNHDAAEAAFKGLHPLGLWKAARCGWRNPILSIRRREMDNWRRARC